jgi:hypothetical protein
MKQVIVIIIAVLGAANASARDFWVHPSGVNAVTCVNNAVDPGTGSSSRTIQLGVQCLAPGDTLHIHGGTYNENIDFHNWSTSGTPTSRITLIVVANETVLMNGNIGMAQGQGYVTWDANIANGGQWILDGGSKGAGAGNGTSGFGNCCGQEGTPDSITSIAVIVDGLELRHFTGSDGDTGSASGITFFGNDGIIRNTKLHDNGCGPPIGPPCSLRTDGTVNGFGGYGIYDAGINTLIENNDIHHNSGYGIQDFSVNCGPVGNVPCFEHNNNIIRNNKIHDNSFYCKAVPGVSSGCGGIVVASGHNKRIYNNLIYNNMAGAVDIGSTCVSCAIYNNTITGNGGWVLGNEGSCTNHCISLTNLFKNNLIYGNSFGTWDYGAIQASNNLCDFTGLYCDLNPKLNSSTNPPRFVDLTNTDFRLCTGLNQPNTNCTSATPSPAINVGTALGSPFNTDFIGTSRPQPPSGNWDVGAYEAPSTVAPPTCPSTQMLVAQYSFDGVATDSTTSPANHNDATLGPGVTYVSAKYNQGVSFPGTVAGVITVGHSASLFMCDFTVSAWVRPPSTFTDFAPVAAIPYGDGTNSGWFLYAGTPPPNGPLGGVCDATCANGGQAQYGTVLAATPTFTYLTITYDHNLAANNVKLWVNGTQVTGAPSTIILPDWAGNMTIGGSAFSEYMPNGSVLDEIRIYNYARTQTQIQQDRDTAINPVVPSGTPVVMKLSALTQKIAGGTTEKIGVAP